MSKPKPPKPPDPLKAAVTKAAAELRTGIHFMQQSGLYVDSSFHKALATLEGATE